MKLLCKQEQLVVLTPVERLVSWTQIQALVASLIQHSETERKIIQIRVKQVQQTKSVFKRIVILKLLSITFSLIKSLLSISNL